MPRGIGEVYFQDEEAFEQALEKLNALTPELGQWHLTQARREHEDPFGELIAPGEYYYNRQVGLGWSDVIRVSRLSMERLLYVVAGNNPYMTKVVELLHLVRMSRKEVAAAVYARLGEKSTEAEG